MITRRLATSLLLSCAVTVPCWAAPITTVTETYDGSIDQAAWRVGPFDQIEPSGGHPGAFLYLARLDAAEPRISTMPALAGQFLGDYRAKKIVSLGIDINLFALGLDINLSSRTADQRPVTLLLHSDMGTPEDTSDDCDAALVGRYISNPGTGWRTYDFLVPAQSPVLPPRWQLVGTCANLPQDDAWNLLIQNVGEARFELGEPGYFYFFQYWRLGFDNPRITSGTIAPGPMTSSTGAVPLAPID